MKVVQFEILIVVLVSCIACVPSSRQLPQVLQEVSGLARIENKVYAINDSGNAPMLYSFDESAPSSTLDSIRLDVENTDFEALASYRNGDLCVCDIGDNRRVRSGVVFARIDPVSGQLKQVLKKNYPTTPHNAEACFTVDDELYILTKAKAGKSKNDAISYLYHVNTVASELQLQDSLSLKGRIVTGASLGESNHLHLVAYNYGVALIFPYARTTVYDVVVSKGTDGVLRFKDESIRERSVRAPFTLTQYEAILAPTSKEQSVIASEKTLWISPRFRKIKN